MMGLRATHGRPCTLWSSSSSPAHPAPRQPQACSGGRHQLTPCRAQADSSRSAASVSPFAQKPSISTTPPGQQQESGETPTAPQQQQQPPYSTHKWSWRGNLIHYVTAGCGKPVLLVHGFGASSGHYRQTIPFLASQGFKVYAIDLVGFGASDKPELQYSIELWADLIVDFMAEFMGSSPVALVGNSIGSLSCLAAAAKAVPGQLGGLVLLNCAGAMNNKGVVADWRIILAWPLLMLIDLLLKTPPIARALFNALAQPETVAKVLRGVYDDEAAVDDELVDIILRPAFTDNALGVFVSVITGPAGPKPWELVPQIQAPLFVAWGDQDPFTPLDGPVGKFFAGLADSRPDTTFALLEGVGHCPQDDRPEVLHKELLPWLRQQLC